MSSGEAACAVEATARRAKAATAAVANRVFMSVFRVCGCGTPERREHRSWSRPAISWWPRRPWSRRGADGGALGGVAIGRGGGCERPGLRGRLIGRLLSGRRLLTERLGVLLSGDRCVLLRRGGRVVKGAGVVEPADGQDGDHTGADDPEHRPVASAHRGRLGFGLDRLIGRSRARDLHHFGVGVCFRHWDFAVLAEGRRDICRAESQPLQA